MKRSRVSASVGIGMAAALLVSAWSFGGPEVAPVPSSLERFVTGSGIADSDAVQAVSSFLGRSAPATRPVHRLNTVTLASGTRVPARWNPCQEAITYRVNPSGLKASQRSGMIRQIRSGFDRLSAADGMTYRYGGTTAFVPQQATLADAPADVVVALVAPAATDLDRSEKSLGFGGVQWVTWSGRHGEGAVVTRGYVILTPAGISSLRPGFGAGKTQGNVILHELGHASGLEHVASTGELMNPLLTARAPSGYGPGDRAGLARAGIAGGCIQVPDDVRTADRD